MFFSANEIIDMAISIEENGEFFYREVAKSMVGGPVKSLFLYLADEDARHRDIFNGLTSSVKTMELTFDVTHEEYPGEYLEYLKAFTDNQVFTKSGAGIKAARRMSTQVEVLDFAAQIELDSVLFYTELKEILHKSQWPIIDKIIREERGHYVKLSELKESVKNRLQL